VVSVADDSPIEFERSETQMWKPKNYDGTFLGPSAAGGAGQVAQPRHGAPAERHRRRHGDPDGPRPRIESPIERNLSIALGRPGSPPGNGHGVRYVRQRRAAGDPLLHPEVQDASGACWSGRRRRSWPRSPGNRLPDDPAPAGGPAQRDRGLREGTLPQPRRQDRDHEREHGRLVHRRVADLMAGVWVGFDTPRRWVTGNPPRPWRSRSGCIS